MHEGRSDIRGTHSYAATALKGQSQFWIDQVNLARRRKGLSAVGITGRGWNELSDAEKRNIKNAQTQDRLEDARQEARLFELQQKLAALKAELGSH